MDLLGHQFLAGARFARDEHGRIGLGNLVDLLQNATNSSAFADDAAGAILQVFDAAPELCVFPDQPAALDGVLDHS